MNNNTMDEVFNILKYEVKKWDVPIITLIAQHTGDPFKVLIATVLSLRTKDEVTAVAAKKLFELADTPTKMLKLSEDTISKVIYPVGFYKTKAKNIIKICQKLITENDSIVPDEIEDLLCYPNVGRKTANLVISDGYNKPAMCVDVHVHRISNRLGYVKTKNPFETEMMLRDKLPQKYWNKYNYILVAFGQHLCRPVSPHCSKCPVNNLCEKVNVSVNR